MGMMSNLIVPVAAGLFCLLRQLCRDESDVTNQDRSMQPRTWFASLLPSAAKLCAQVYDLEKAGGSIIAGVIKMMQEKKRNPEPPRDARLPPKPKGQTVGSFRDGLQTLPKAIAARLGDKTRLALICNFTTSVPASCLLVESASAVVVSREATLGSKRSSSQLPCIGAINSWHCKLVQAAVSIERGGISSVMRQLCPHQSATAATGSTGPCGRSCAALTASSRCTTTLRTAQRRSAPGRSPSRCPPTWPQTWSARRCPTPRTRSSASTTRRSARSRSRTPCRRSATTARPRTAACQVGGRDAWLLLAS